MSSIKMWSLLAGIIVLVSVCGVKAQIDITFCNPSEIIADPANVDITQFLPDVFDQFEQTVEINANGFTSEVVELYDGIRNAGVTATKTSTSQVAYYANYEHDELFEFKENYQCTVQKLSEADPSILPFLPVKLPNGTLHLVFTLSALIATQQLKLTYIGSNQDIRGIPVNEWQGCLYTPGDQTTSRITISYSDPLKYTPAVFTEDWKSMPVQTLVESRKRGEEKIDMTIGSITRYRPYIDIKSSTYNEYLTPSGYFCPGRKNLKPFPEIPNAFAVLNQIAQPTPNTQDTRGYVTHWQEEYDYTNKLFRYDTANISEVHDFTTGLNYFLNKVTGVCTINKLNIGLDGVGAIVDGATVVEMRNPAGFFGFEGSEYHYVGVKIANGIACDVWIGKNKDQDEVFEWYFMADTWSSPFQAGKTTGFPVMTIVYSTVVAPKPMTVISFNHWFLFTDHLVNILEFEIERCNKGIDRQGFIFTLPIGQAQLIREHQGVFVQSTILALQKVARVALLRIAHFAMDIAKDHIYITFAVFDRSSFYGNVVTPPDDVILDDAIKNLQDYFSKQPLEITFPIGSGKFATVYSDQTLRATHVTNEGYLQIDIHEVNQGFDTGSIISMIIMMTLIGIVTGFLLIILHKDKKINLPFLRLFYSD